MAKACLAFLVAFSKCGWEPKRGALRRKKQMQTSPTLYPINRIVRFAFKIYEFEITEKLSLVNV
jgi:hypothetical protein